MAGAPLPPFQRLLDAHGNDVLGFLIAAVGPQDAEDCFQETWIAALRAYDRLADDRNLRGWLLTIAHRKAIDHHRAGSRRAGAGQANQAAIDRRASEATDRGKSEAATTADAALSGAEMNGSGRLWSLVGTLPPKQRSAIALRFASDLAYRQIGEALECSEEAARRSVHEGLKTLRKELK